MEPFTFIDKSEIDERAAFANAVCQLLYDKHYGNLDVLATVVEPIYNNFQGCVRNIYELIGSQIPLFALYELKTYGAKNWDFTKKEYADALSRAEKACRDYYEN